jgi:two-component system, OmpR family, response regulator MtrA
MKILVIDDDPAMIELIKLLLSPTLYTVFTTNDGKTGVNLAKQENPDVILLDLMMPELNGSAVCKEIRKFSKVPILIMSAIDSPGMVAEVLDAGADDYIVKPVSNKLLLARIDKIARRSNFLQTAVHREAYSSP